MWPFYPDKPRYITKNGTPIMYRTLEGQGVLDITPTELRYKAGTGKFSKEMEAVIEVFSECSDHTLATVYGIKRTTNPLKPFVAMTDEELDQYNLQRGGEYDIAFAA